MLTVIIKGLSKSALSGEELRKELFAAFNETSSEYGFGQLKNIYGCPSTTYSLPVFAMPHLTSEMKLCGWNTAFRPTDFDGGTHLTAFTQHYVASQAEYFTKEDLEEYFGKVLHRCGLGLVDEIKIDSNNYDWHADSTGYVGTGFEVNATEVSVGETTLKVGEVEICQVNHFDTSGGRKGRPSQLTVFGLDRLVFLANLSRTILDRPLSEQFMDNPFSLSNEQLSIEDGLHVGFIRDAYREKLIALQHIRDAQHQYKAHVEAICHAPESVAKSIKETYLLKDEARQIPANLDLLNIELFEEFISTYDEDEESTVRQMSGVNVPRELAEVWLAETIGGEEQAVTAEATLAYLTQSKDADRVPIGFRIKADQFRYLIAADVNRDFSEAGLVLRERSNPAGSLHRLHDLSINVASKFGGPTFLNEQAVRSVFTEYVAKTPIVHPRLFGLVTHALADRNPTLDGVPTGDAMQYHRTLQGFPLENCSDLALKLILVCRASEATSFLLNHFVREESIGSNDPLAVKRRFRSAVRAGFRLGFSGSEIAELMDLILKNDRADPEQPESSVLRARNYLENRLDMEISNSEGLVG